MKAMKKTASLLLALMLLISLAAPGMAAGNGKITVKGHEGEEYTLYKLFDATIATQTTTDPETEETTTKTTGISYKLMSGKTGFTAGSYDGSTWFKLSVAGDTASNVMAVDGFDPNSFSADQTETFSNWAQAYGEKIGETKTADKTGVVKFEGLDYGYYFISTTTGSLVTIDSAAPEAEVEDKNETPTIEKKITAVSPDGTVTNAEILDDAGKSALAQIGDTIEYTLTVTAHKGAEKYVVKDVLADGLTLNYKGENAIVIKAGNDTLIEGKDYTIDDRTGDHYLQINFTQEYLDTITTDKTITITYTAVLNENAVVGVTGNPNTVKLEYGDKSTVESSTTVYTGEIIITKVDANDPAKNMAGVEFTLQDKETGLYYSWDEASGKVVWSEDPVTLTVGEDSKLHIKGLAAGTYILTETKTLSGYNLLTTPIEITISAEDYTATIEGEEGAEPREILVEAVSDENLKQTRKVENSSGQELPSTGGIGTTIFTVVGVALMVGAAVLFIAKKRSTGD